MTILNARVVGPVEYQNANGQALSVPLGPCLIERLDEESVAVIWGDDAQSSAAVPVQEIMDARESGRLVLLD